MGQHVVWAYLKKDTIKRRKWRQPSSLLSPLLKQSNCHLSWKGRTFHEKPPTTGETCWFPTQASPKKYQPGFTPTHSARSCKMLESKCYQPFASAPCARGALSETKAAKRPKTDERDTQRCEERKKRTGSERQSGLIVPRLFRAGGARRQEAITVCVCAVSL